MPYDDYQIQDELGQGGMGVVYQALQISMGRLVAIKTFHRQQHVTPDKIQRFDFEIKTLAMLNHPNVVTVHEYGINQEGVPWFSMEYVDGGTLEEEIDRTLKSGELKSDKWSAQLIKTLAEALQAVHDIGIVHRDLKPANVLLTSDYVPKISDFGVARFLDAHGNQTQTGEVLGTPSFMSPEQAAGKTNEVGSSTDIYSLGSILYMVLTGRPPLQGENREETLQLVLTKEPVPPSSLRQVSRDLETICLKCLEKDPRKRYYNAKSLAEDLGRYLSGLPIQARPIGIVGRTWRRTRRNPVVAGLIAALLFVTVFGFIGILYLWQIADRDRALAQSESKRATKNFDSAQLAIDRMLGEVGVDLLANVPQMEPVRKKLLEEALSLQDSILQTNPDNPRAKWEAGRAYQRVGEISQYLGHTVQGKNAIEKAIPIFTDLVKTFPEQRLYKQGLAESYNQLANLLAFSRRDAEAVKADQEAVRLVNELLVDGAGEEAETLWQVSLVHHNHAFRMFQLNQFDEAHRSCLQSVQHGEKLIQLSPENVNYQKRLASSYNLLGNVKKNLKEPEAAEKSYRKAIEISTALVSNHESTPGLLHVLAMHRRNLADLLRGTNRLQQSREEYEKILVTMEILVKDFPTVPIYQNELGEGQCGLALALDPQSEKSRRIQLLQQALSHVRLALKPDPLNLRYRKSVCKMCFELTAVLNEPHNHREVASTVEVWQEAAFLPIDYYLIPGRMMACVNWASKDKTISDVSRAELVNVYSKKTIESLRRAVEKGHVNAKFVREDGNFNPLRDREDFKAFLNEIEKAEASHVERQ